MAIAFMHTAPRVLLRSIYNFIGLLFDVIVYLYIFLRPSSRLREARKHEDQTNIRITFLQFENRKGSDCIKAQCTSSSKI